MCSTFLADPASMINRKVPNITLGDVNVSQYFYNSSIYNASLSNGLLSNVSGLSNMQLRRLLREHIAIVEDVPDAEAEVRADQAEVEVNLCGCMHACIALHELGHRFNEGHNACMQIYHLYTQLCLVSYVICRLLSSICTCSVQQNGLR